MIEIHASTHENLLLMYNWMPGDTITENITIVPTCIIIAETKT